MTNYPPVIKVQRSGRGCLFWFLIVGAIMITLTIILIVTTLHAVNTP